MTSLTYDPNGFRTIGEPGQAHARTELRTDTGRTFSAQGIGENVRTALTKHAEGSDTALSNTNNREG